MPSLVDISGSYSAPAQGLTFSGIEFTGTSWLGPNTSQGYADQASPPPLPDQVVVAGTSSRTPGQSL